MKYAEEETQLKQIVALACSRDGAGLGCESGIRGRTKGPPLPREAQVLLVRRCGRDLCELQVSN